MADPLQDVILIRNCPCCKGLHLYAVKIQRIPFMGSNQLPVRPLKLTRLFTCPSKDEEFMVEFHLIQPFNLTYHKIQTLGLISSPNDLASLTLSTSYYDKNGLTDYLRTQGIQSSSLLVPPEGVAFGSINIVCVIN